MWCDDLDATYISINLIFYAHIKYVENNYHPLIGNLDWVSNNHEWLGYIYMTCLAYFLVWKDKPTNQLKKVKSKIILPMSLSTKYDWS